MGLSARHPRPELLGLLEKRLDPADRARVEQHVAACAVCQAELAELAQVHDMLNAVPRALRGLAEPSSNSWPIVWARVQRVPMRRMAPQLNLFVSLAVVVFVLAAAFPRNLSNKPVLGPDGGVQTAVQTPVAAQMTPSADKTAAPGAAQLSTASAGIPLTGARAMPAPTPVPGLKG